MDAIPRRQALLQLGCIAAGLAAMGCTPMRVLLHAYPQAFDTDRALVDRVLRAFVMTVIPGASENEPDLARAHTDPAYPFARHSAFFAADLSRRACRRYNGRPFDRLEPRERTAVILEGLSADGTTRKLYNGAIVLAQIAFFAGIYDDKKGCPLIGFEGGDRWRPLSDFAYPHPERFFARPLTDHGNYV